MMTACVHKVCEIQQFFNSEELPLREKKAHFDSFFNTHNPGLHVWMKGL